jgi:prepilin-type N-terminal cleavage/methylation domain-containing protein
MTGSVSKLLRNRATPFSGGPLHDRRLRRAVSRLPGKTPAEREQTAFTLIELLVVIAIISILAAILLPVLNAAKIRAQAAYCMNNTRELSLAVIMYAHDNADELPPNVDGITSPPGLAGETATIPCWVAGVLSLGFSLDNTNTVMLVNHGAYPYGAYLGSDAANVTVFKCPADQSICRIYGKIFPRVRSYSMNNYVGGPSRSKSTDPNPVTNPNSNTSMYPTFPKLTLMRAPSLTFVILDEREDSINDGVFFNEPDAAAAGRYFLEDVPSNRHSHAGGFSFGDGHSEIHKWTSSYINQPLSSTPINNQDLTGTDGVGDVLWLDENAVGRTSIP